MTTSRNAVWALMAALLVSPLWAQRQGIILEKIIVKVNGEILTQSELERLQIDELKNLNRAADVPRDLSSDPALMAALAEVTPPLLFETIDDLLLVQHGREVGIKFTEANFQVALDNVKKQNKFNDDQLAAALKQAGMTMDDLRQNFERSWIVSNVEQREIMRNVTLTEEEARQYYRANPGQFTKPPTVTLREILVAVPVETVGGQPAVNVALDEAAKEKALAVRARAMKGEDFVALVAEVSESPTKANGGLIGPVLVGDLNPVVGAALEPLKPGEVSEPIRTRAGYQLFKLETRTVPEVEPFDKIRNEIAQKIYERRLGAEREKFLQRLRAQALIEWKDDTYRAMYERMLAQRGKSGG